MAKSAHKKPSRDDPKQSRAFIEKADTSNRSLVLVDQDGKVEWSHESPSPIEIPGANLIFDALSK